jgi:hypothetical protein
MGWVGGGEREKRTTAIGRGRHGATNLRWYNIKAFATRVSGASVGFGAPGLHFGGASRPCGHPTPSIHPPYPTHPSFYSLLLFVLPLGGGIERERQWCPSHTTQSTPSLPSSLREFSAALPCAGLFWPLAQLLF